MTPRACFKQKLKYWVCRCEYNNNLVVKTDFHYGPLLPDLQLTEFRDRVCVCSVLPQISVKKRGTPLGKFRRSSELTQRGDLHLVIYKPKMSSGDTKFHTNHCPHTARVRLAARDTRTSNPECGILESLWTGFVAKVEPRVIRVHAAPAAGGGGPVAIMLPSPLVPSSSIIKVSWTQLNEQPRRRPPNPTPPHSLSLSLFLSQ